jgi:PKD repeat protein
MVNTPALVADFSQSATSIIVSTTVSFTDTSTTNGPPITGWLWSFGDGGLSTQRTPAHQYTSVGTYTVSLRITDSLGYTATHTVVDAVVVQLGCTPLTGVTFVYDPASPLIHSAVTFTATTTPVDASTPIEYLWTFGDGLTTTLTSAVVQHTYHVSGTQMVSVTARNACTPGGVSSATQPIDVKPYRTFLPLVMKSP